MRRGGVVALWLMFVSPARLGESERPRETHTLITQPKSPLLPVSVFAA